MPIPPDPKHITRREFVDRAAAGALGLTALSLTPLERALAMAALHSPGATPLGVTKIRRIENRTTRAVHVEVPDGLFGRKLFDIAPGRMRMVDFGVPWAGDANAFRDHHMRVDVGGAPRWWVWQADSAGADLVRVNSAAQWSATGRPVPGYAGVAKSIFDVIGPVVMEGDFAAIAQLAIPDRAVVVLESHIEVFPIVSKPAIGVNVTTIRRVRNDRRAGAIRLLNRQNPETDSRTVAPGESVDVSMHVPFAAQAGEFAAGQRLEVVDVPTGRTLFWIWQSGEDDGDFIRAVTANAWRPTAPPLGGLPATGVSPADMMMTADRELVVADDGLKIFPSPGIVDGALGLAASFIHPFAMQGADASSRAVTATPKYRAVSFSAGGAASDALLQGRRGARYLYDDSGKRYEFQLERDGRLLVRDANGPVAIQGARSYQRKRAGENIAIPPFELVAASGGRVFAKARGADRFFLMTPDEMFVYGERARGRAAADRTVPSNYFKLDPEFGNAGARTADLLDAIRDVRADHPASERFPIFRRVLAAGVSDMMIVRVEKRTWYELDARPPRNATGVAMGDVMLGLMPLLVLKKLGRAFLAAGAAGSAVPPIVLGGALAQLPSMADQIREEIRGCTELASRPPDGIPVWKPVAYERDGQRLEPPAIDFQHVLDIGVGHVHYHQQDEGVTGGEIQPVKVPINATLYRLFNGPIRDGDGYIDGTCNLYALVRLAPGGRQRYALLYMDEQSYFTQRWRMVDPDDREGMMFAIITALPKRDATPHPCDSSLPLEPDPTYAFDPYRYWDPFRADLIDEKSRLAVAAQVLLVTGRERPGGAGAGRIFSINFSFSSIDRSWRWRALPEGAEELYVDESSTSLDGELSGPDNAVWPQTIRLREDMTIVMRGRRGGVAGRWYQRYLPSDNQLAPLATELPRDRMPDRGFRHEWKFMPEAVFQLADRYSHLGVYDRVSSRSQYYVLRPVTPADDAALARLAGATEPWVDAERRLYVSQWKFRWHEPDAIGVDPFDTPSMFNPETMFRITRHGAQWIATWWDKRDDDILRFDNVGETVTLVNGAQRANVVVQSHAYVNAPPTLAAAGLRWTGDAERPVAVMLTTTTPQAIARVRIAALTPEVRWLADEVVGGKLSAISESIHEYAWRPSPEAEAQLRRYWPEGKAPDATVGLWVEDLVGHVVTPERIVTPSTMRVVVEPALIRLGVPTALTVRAFDQRTGAELRDGAVLIDGTRVGTTGQPFTKTFTLRAGKREFDPETKRWIESGEAPSPPSGVVTAESYIAAPIPLNFTADRARMRVRVDPAGAIRAGVATSITIFAEDATTGAAVPGAAVTGGPAGARVGEPFAVTPNGAVAAARVTAPGYEPAPIPWPTVYTPEMRVSLDPQPTTGATIDLLVTALDAATGAPVPDAVAVVTTFARSGAICRPTTTRIPAGQRVRVTLSGCREGSGSRAPTIVVTAPGYAAVTPVQLGSPADDADLEKRDEKRRPPMRP